MMDRSGKNGLFNLHRFLRPSILQKTLVQIKPVVPTQASAHLHAHNIYFKKPSQALRQSAQPRSQFRQLITPSVLIKLKIVEPTDYMIGQLSWHVIQSWRYASQMTVSQAQTSWLIIMAKPWTGILVNQGSLQHCPRRHLIKWNGVDMVQLYG